MTKAFVFVLQPSIPADSPTNRTTDVACDFGIWLMEVAGKLPLARCDGFDILGGQSPSKHDVEGGNPDRRVDFHVRDAADPQGPGEEFVGQFDIVAVRLMYINLIGPHWDQAVKNVVAILKGVVMEAPHRKQAAKAFIALGNWSYVGRNIA